MDPRTLLGVRRNHRDTTDAAARAGDNTEMKSGRSMPGQRSAPRPQNPINVVGQHHGVGVQYAAIVARQQDGAAP